MSGIGKALRRSSAAAVNLSLRCVLSLLLSASLPLALAAAAGAETSAGPPAATAQGPEARTGVYLEELWRASGAPGVSLAVARADRLLFAAGLGYADLDNLVPATAATVYNVGSVSKAITGVAVMQLVEQGRVGLDDPIRKYVPELPERDDAITVRHLMTHTSGIRHYGDDDFPHGLGGENVAPFGSFEEAIGIFKDDPLLFKPGAFYRYSSYGVNLLQGVIERVSGLGFEDYMTRRVWGPTGMLRTAFDRPARVVPGRARGYRLVDGRPENQPYDDVTYKFASGGMISTVEDLARFALAVNHGRLLAPATVALMFKPDLESVLSWQGDAPPRPERFRQALLWRTREDDAGRTFVYACGTVKGFNACLVDYVDEDLVLAIASNLEAIGFVPLLTVADFFRPPPPSP